MNRYLLGSVLIVIFSLPCNADDAIGEVRQVQTERFKAMTTNNLEVLDTILSDDLTYTHTTGQIDTKAEFVESLWSQNIAYHSIEPTDVHIRIYDSVAVTTGIAAMKVSAKEKHFQFSIRFIEVYKKSDRDWRLVAWQSLRLPDRG